VTGAASGIGARTAELAIALGADVIGVDVRVPAHPVGTFVSGDIASQAGIDALLSHLPSRIDALCNVAGVSGEGGIVPTLAINFYGLRALTEALVPRLREGGSVVNVASFAGVNWRANVDRARTMVDAPGFPDVAQLAAANGATDDIAYPLSKELLLLWTYRAARESQFTDRSIRVNAVSPGPVETPILSEFRAILGDAKVSASIARVGRSGTPADIAPPILILCSDGARWINGVNLATDGGLEAAALAQSMNF
jgi:NAD(P)-dependent dehydrogenase (short-subunit alcohol dehydrogenase family)